MHYYQAKSFTPDQETILRSTANRSYYQENFLTQDEFDLCRRLVLAVNEWPEHGKTSKYWGFGLDNGVGPQLLWLLKKVQAIVPHFDLDFFAIQEAIIPWKIHADIRWSQDYIPYKVVLLPMDVEPVTGPIEPDVWPKTATITFHQRNFLSVWNKSAADKISKTGNTDQSDWPKPIDNVQFEGMETGYQIDYSIWKEYLTHLPYDHLEGLVIDQINIWRPRSIMYWDNTALHCADNFLSTHIKTKRSLMLFSKYQQ